MNRIDNETASRTPAGREVQASPAFDLRDVAQMENTFITLMSAQIQNQDPTNPADSSQYINQYANLAQVRSMANLTRVAQGSLVLVDNLQTLTAAGLVGQQVKVASDSVTLAGRVIDGEIRLTSPSGSTQLELVSESGRRTTLQLGPQQPGRVPVRIDPAALGLPAPPPPPLPPGGAHRQRRDAAG
ncbi:flagellar hook capping FlgD N-terminal domain-containing protein [Metapseudomonas otitidis]|uniref:flagellar hook capping FlgD N-terminal domain-containing protein n=1 Tax=Metapseudomonas otitidis TaxID=319939 RepID=UPI00280B5A9D|nr:flagellar hook capping FlgD N-terminal domain-containing protein [Pseudomonas otitidis]